MGLLSHLFGRKASGAMPPAARRTREQSRDSREGADTGDAIVESSPAGLVKLTGTTTFAKDAAAQLMERHGQRENGYLEISGFLQREPENSADPLAVAVHAEGERVAYLPGYLAARLAIGPGEAHPLALQFFAAVVGKGLRIEGWGWIGDSEPQWQWSPSNRPPMSAEEKRAADQQDRSSMVRQGLGEGGQRARELDMGMVRGLHYLELIEPIKQLKREKRFAEALGLCYAAIEGAERGRGGREPAPWYTEQAAIVHRKLGERDAEIQVLERWLRVCPPERRGGSSIQQRLDKLKASN